MQKPNHGTTIITFSETSCFSHFFSRFLSKKSFLKSGFPISTTHLVRWSKDALPSLVVGLCLPGSEFPQVTAPVSKPFPLPSFSHGWSRVLQECRPSKSQGVKEVQKVSEILFGKETS